jgi:DNA/RNA endonuclease G (NUC1)
MPKQSRYTKSGYGGAAADRLARRQCAAAFTTGAREGKAALCASLPENSRQNRSHWKRNDKKTSVPSG